MERITSRKNRVITHIKKLAADSAYRHACGEYVCDGLKMLKEAAENNVEISCILWAEKPELELPEATQYCAPAELIGYVSPMKNSPGPVFTVRTPDVQAVSAMKRVIILEEVQDPGNVGTVLRTAGAFGIDAVILTGGCADIYNPKTVKSTMGAIFRQRVIEAELPEIAELLEENGLTLYGAALTEDAAELGTFEFGKCAVAIGSEGRGLSRELLGMCGERIIIPMDENCESLNASIAASIIMWEMRRK